MSDIPFDRFISPSDRDRYVNIDVIKKRFYNYMEQMPDNKYILAVGSDSTTIKVDKKHKDVIYVVSISLYRKYMGGIYYFVRFTDAFKDHFTRLYNEVYFSLVLMEHIKPWYEDINKQFNVDPEIHIDVGEEGFSGKYYSTLKGLAKSSGITVVSKPNSYVSSAIADKYT